MPRILVLDDYQDFARRNADWSRIVDGQVDVFTEHVTDPAARAARFGPYDVIVAMRERTPFPAELLRALPKLRLLVTTGMRNASIDMAACKAQGIVLSGAPGSKTSLNATAEVAWGLILGLVKRLPAGQAAMQAGHWQPSVTESLTGKTLGVVGLGKLGQCVARVGLAFGMKVVAWSPNMTQERATAAVDGVVAVDKAALFAGADIVSLHIVLSATTRGIVQREDLARLKPSAYLVNTARAELIEAGALLEALQGRRIAGAGVDVFEEEPLPKNDPLLSLPNVITSPHVGYVTDDNLRAFYRSAVEAIVAWQAGKPINEIASY